MHSPLPYATKYVLAHRPTTYGTEQVSKAWMKLVRHVYSIAQPNSARDFFGETYP
jgi:hypothetical protein